MSRATPFVAIDGARGEGGGQILRTSLALSAITGAPVHIENIRARRQKPGLMRQHLTAVLAAKEVCGAEVEGATLRSQEMWFRPGRVRGGRYRFAVGTAGSACLVFQTVLPILLSAQAPSTVVFEGGTHNPMSPPIDFIVRSFLPLIARMGASVQVQLERHGFYPAGGGRFTATIAPWADRQPLELMDGGALLERRARAILAQLKREIGVRELRVVRSELGWHPKECVVEVVKQSRGPGNVLFCELRREHVTTMVCGFGEKGVRAETVAQRAVERLRVLLANGVPVDKYLADQLMLPMALGRGGRYLTAPLSMHSQTNREVIQMFLDVDIDVAQDGDDALVTISRR